MDKLNLDIIKILRKKSNIKLTNLGKILNKTPATILYRLKFIFKEYIIKNTILFNFENIGYPIKVFYLVDSNSKRVENILFEKEEINNLAKLNNEKFLAKCNFKSFKELNNFERNLKYFGANLIKYDVVGEMKLEEFMT